MNAQEQRAAEPIRPVSVVETAAVPLAGLMQLITGYYTTAALYVVAKLEVADRLAGGPRPVDELAAAVGADPDYLYRVMRTLATLGVFKELDDRCFELTDVAHFLRTDIPGSVHALALLQGERWHWEPWGYMLEGVRAGRPAFELVTGERYYDYVESHSEAGATFDAAMGNFAAQAHVLAASVYDFSQTRTLVDVGGGKGALLAALLAAHPEMEAILMDRPGTLQAARTQLGAAGVLDRCRLVGGDFFESIPTGGDTYLFSMVIGDFDHDESIRILRNARAAIPDSGRLVILDVIVPAPNEPSFAAMIDLELLATTKGRSRTRAELEAVLDTSGFRLARVFDSPYPETIAECLPT